MEGVCGCLIFFPQNAWWYICLQHLASVISLWSALYSGVIAGKIYEVQCLSFSFECKHLVTSAYFSMLIWHQYMQQTEHQEQIPQIPRILTTFLIDNAELQPVKKMILYTD